MLEDLKPYQMVNHFLGNNLIVTKVGLQNSLKNLVWWSTHSQDEFFPKCYDLTDFKELNEFKEDFRVNRAESILKRYIQKKECSRVEKLLIAIHINEKRLKDIDDLIDDPDLENLVTENEWTMIEKEKSSDEIIQNLHQEDWYQKIQKSYQHLCSGEKMANEAIEEESEESKSEDGEGEGEGEEEEEPQPKSEEKPYEKFEAF